MWRELLVVGVVCVAVEPTGRRAPVAWNGHKTVMLVADTATELRISRKTYGHGHPAPRNRGVAHAVSLRVTDERRYDDREVGLILKRVVELHERNGKKADARAMTRGEIEQVVTELGLSTALVARAASELSVQDVRNRPVWWLGGKMDLMFEEVVDGHIDEATMTQMLEVLRRYLGDPGKVEVEGGARIWSTTSRTSPVHFTVVEHAGKSTLRLEEGMLAESGATVSVSAFVGGFGGFLTIIPLKAFVLKWVLLVAMGPLAAVGATAGWLVGRALWRSRSTDREDERRRIFAEILALAVPKPRALAEGRETAGIDDD
jgi:hypothetical protein